MILILNCLVSEKSVYGFNQAMERHLGDLPVEYEIFRIRETAKIDDLNKYTHLIISGSGASALDDNPWDEDLKSIILHFVNNKKAILGICYGHQFLVKTLAGVDHIRKAANPEVGFAEIDIDDNELFKGIHKPVFSVAHFDEVFDLNEDFQIIARNKNCSVHTFQYKKLPVWGTQFHPEYGVEDTKDNIDDFAKEDPDIEKHLMKELDNEDKLLQNKLLFENFVRQ